MTLQELLQMTPTPQFVEYYLNLVQAKLYALEDTLYQYISNPNKRRASK